MVILVLGTGMRVSEVLGLDREQINLKNAVVKLKDFKNGDEGIIPLPPQVVEMRQRCPAPLYELFPGWTSYTPVKAFKREAQKAGLQGVTFPALRHTFASYAVTAGIDLYTVAKLLGHKTIQMVQRYAHLAPAYLQQAV